MVTDSDLAKNGAGICETLTDQIAAEFEHDRRIVRQQVYRVWRRLRGESVRSGSAPTHSIVLTDAEAAFVDTQGGFAAVIHELLAQAMQE
jgi:hypothetical protein